MDKDVFLSIWLLFCITIVPITIFMIYSSIQRKKIARGDYSGLKKELKRMRDNLFEKHKKRQDAERLIDFLDEISEDDTIQKK